MDGGPFFVLHLTKGRVRGKGLVVTQQGMQVYKVLPVRASRMGPVVKLVLSCPGGGGLESLGVVRG